MNFIFARQRLLERFAREARLARRDWAAAGRLLSGERERAAAFEREEASARRYVESGAARLAAIRLQADSMAGDWSGTVLRAELALKSARAAAASSAGLLREAQAKVGESELAFHSAGRDAASHASRVRQMEAYRDRERLLFHRKSELAETAEFAEAGAAIHYATQFNEEAECGDTVEAPL